MSWSHSATELKDENHAMYEREFIFFPRLVLLEKDWTMTDPFSHLPRVVFSNTEHFGFICAGFEISKSYIPSSNHNTMEGKGILIVVLTALKKRLTLCNLCHVIILIGTISNYRKQFP